jgi:hypothetical protein
MRKQKSGNEFSAQGDSERDPKEGGERQNEGQCTGETIEGDERIEKQRECKGRWTRTVRLRYGWTRRGKMLLGKMGVDGADVWI